MTGVILQLPDFGAVSGRVVDQAGHFLPEAEVRCGMDVVSADLLGNYRLPMLPAGTQELTATNLLTGMKGSTTVTLRSGQETTGVDIVVAAAATVRGTVSIVRTPGTPAVPLANAKVTFDGYHVVQTNAQGSYLLPEHPARS